jgi:predicted Zn-dependent protease
MKQVKRLAHDWLCRRAVPILQRLEEPIERTQRTFIKLLAGILVALAVVILVAWGGCHTYQRWEERHQIRQATAFFEHADFKSAALSARRALQLNANSTGAMRIMAQLAEKARDRVALDWRRKIVQLEPASTDDAIALSNCARQFGDMQTAEKSLAKISPAGKNTAAFHVAVGRLANARKNPTEAKREFGQALQLAPGDESYQMEYALACLEQTSTAERAEGLGILERLRSSPAQRIAATRALFVDGVTHHHDPEELRNLARDLQSYPEASFPDRLLYLDVLRQIRDREYANYLTQIEKDATAKPADLGALFSWMNTNGMSLVAIDFAKSLPQELLGKWPVPWTLAEAYGKISDWPALEKLTTSGNWEEYEFLRHAYLTRALRGQNNPAAATRTWTDATKAAAARPQSVLMLARMIYDWGWKNESIELLWQLTKYPEMQFEALHALYLYYQKGHDTQGLYRVLSRLSEIDPGDMKVQNNLAQISLLLNVDLDRAEKRASELYSKEPADAAYLSTYAFSLYVKGDSKGALNAMRKLSEDDLKQPSLAAYYAIFLAAAGDKERARTYLELGKQAELLPEEKALLERAERLAK